MTFLCFVLDLRSLPLSLLKDLSQSLLQLANLYAVSSPRGGSPSQTPGDLIGLFYIQRNRSSGIDELEIAYSPRGQFNLRDFHHAVSSLPEDCFLPDMDASEIPQAEGWDLLTGPMLSKLLHDDYLFSWGGKNTARKVSIISSLLLESVAHSREMLMDAASKKVKLDFILIETEERTTLSFSQASGKIKAFLDCISDMKNCVLNTYSWDDWLFHGLVKSWLQELKGDLEEPLKATFCFKNTVIDSCKRFSCNLFASAVDMVDGFVPCQICRCHGLPAGSAAVKPSVSCPVTNQELSSSELSELGVKVGEQTVLHLPSFQSYSEPQRVHGCVTFNVIERTSLFSISEGVILGTSYCAVPCDDADLSSTECGKQNLNTRRREILVKTLHALDQGLVCTSTCNMDTMRQSSFTFFYLLQPSEKGTMLLRKLASSEEIMTIPRPDGPSPSSALPEIESSIQANLLKIVLRDYNPLEHEVGLHAKLNALVKESLLIGAAAPRRSKTISKPDARRANDQPSIPTMLDSQFEKDGYMLTQLTDKGRKACADDEWEQLVVNELSDSLSPAFQSVKEIQVKSPEEILAEKTSSILERLEPPRSQKLYPSSPVVAVNNLKKQITGPASVFMKRPLVPFEQGDHEREYSLTQPLKPNFQRFKRKLGQGF